MDIYQRLDTHYGNQNWWPADSPFEVMVGAILTQNTRWQNVEAAIANLNQEDMLKPDTIISCDVKRLENLIRPSGFFRQKAARLVLFSRFLIKHGGIDALTRQQPMHLRKLLLAIHGIGPETADSILLYALDKPVFVVDAYTKRIFSRLGIIEPDLTYHDVQDYFHRLLQQDRNLFGQYHALIVQHAKAHCRSRPLCDHCPILSVCEHGRQGGHDVV